jgi:hypothetical protein
VPRNFETADSVDDDIKEFGWAAVREGLHRMGRAPTEAELAHANWKHGRPHNTDLVGPTGCIHKWAEDETGAEPPFDVCTNCGERRY